MTAFLFSLSQSQKIYCYFVACLGQEGVAHSSIRTYLSGVHQIQIANGYPDPHIDQMPHLHQILKGVKVQAGRTGKTPRPRLPITPSILLKLRAVWLQGTSFHNTMLWAAATTTFFSFCRSGKTSVPSETT